MTPAFISGIMDGVGESISMFKITEMERFDAILRLHLVNKSLTPKARYKILQKNYYITSTLTAAKSLSIPCLFEQVIRGVHAKKVPVNTLVCSRGLCPFPMRS